MNKTQNSSWGEKKSNSKQPKQKENPKPTYSQVQNQLDARQTAGERAAQMQ